LKIRYKIHREYGKGTIGMNWRREWRLCLLLRRNKQLDKELNEELGQYTGRLASIILDKEAKSKFLRHRPLTFALKNKAEVESL
ncbi:hypothetical protein T09_7974, partial [Trichinella sp. T9]